MKNTFRIGTIVAAIVALSVLFCAPPPAPPPPSEDDFRVDHVTVKPAIPDDSLQLGDKATITFSLQPASFAAHLKIEFFTKCGTLVILDSALSLNKYTDSVTVSLPPLTCPDSAHIDWSLTLSSGKKVDGTIALLVYGEPPVITDWSDRNVRAKEGDTCIFFIQAQSTAPIAYRWMFGTDTLSGIRDSVLSFKPIKAVDAGTYIAVARSKWGADTLVFSLAVVPLNAPTAPANLRITGLTATSVDLAWDNVAGADSFRIYRADSAAGSIFSRIASTSMTTYKDNGTSVGKHYLYRVSAFKTGLESADGLPISTYRTPLIPVTGLAAARPNVTTSQVLVSWNPMVGARSEDGIEYVLYAGSSRTANDYIARYTGNAVSYTLTTSTTLHFYVVVRNRFGEVSMASDTVAIALGASLVPQWAAESLSLAISEGDSAAFVLSDSLANSSWLNVDTLRFRIADKSQLGAIRGDSVYTIRAGRRSAGKYVDTLVADYNGKNDTTIVRITIIARICKLTITPTVNGTISASQDTATCRWGDTVTLTATPSANYRLYSWDGAVTGDVSPAKVVMTANKTVGATFIPTNFACAPLAAGATVSISAQLETAAKAAVRPVWVCLGEGLYEAGTIGVEGKVDLWVE